MGRNAQVLLRTADSELKPLSALADLHAVILIAQWAPRRPVRPEIAPGDLLSSQACLVLSPAWGTFARRGICHVHDICISAVRRSLCDAGTRGRGVAADRRRAVPRTTWTAHVFRHVSQHRNADQFHADAGRRTRTGRLSAGTTVGSHYCAHRAERRPEAGDRPVHAARINPGVHSARTLGL